MLKVALIGLGSMGQNHYRVLKTLHRVELVALCDVVKTKEYEEPFYTSVDELFENAEFGGVYKPLLGKDNRFSYTGSET